MTPTDVKRLRELANKLNRGPTGHDDSAICSGCRSSVSLRADSDWEDGYVCDGCAQDWFEESSPSVVLSLLDQLAALEKAAKHAVMTFEHALALDYLGEGSTRGMAVESMNGLQAALSALGGEGVSKRLRAIDAARTWNPSETFLAGELRRTRKRLSIALRALRNASRQQCKGGYISDCPSCDAMDALRVIREQPTPQPRPRAGQNESEST